MFSIANRKRDGGDKGPGVKVLRDDNTKIENSRIWYEPADFNIQRQLKTPINIALNQMFPDFRAGTAGNERCNIRAGYPKQRIVYKNNVEVMVQVVCNDDARLKRCDIFTKKQYVKAPIDNWQQTHA